MMIGRINIKYNDGRYGLQFKKVLVVHSVHWDYTTILYICVIVTTFLQFHTINFLSLKMKQGYLLSIHYTIVFMWIVRSTVQYRISNFLVVLNFGLPSFSTLYCSNVLLTSTTVIWALVNNLLYAFYFFRIVVSLLMIHHSVQYYMSIIN